MKFAPHDSQTLCNYGSLLACKGAGSELAETLIKECLGFSDTAYSEQMARWGHAREGLAQADILYSLALESDPMHSVTLFNYAYMLHNEKTEGSALAAAVIKARLGVDQETYRQQLEIWGGKWREGLLQADILYSLALCTTDGTLHPEAIENYAVLLADEKIEEGSIFAERVIKQKLGYSATEYSLQLDDWGTTRVGVAQSDILFHKALIADPENVFALRSFAAMITVNAPEDGSSLLAQY